MIVYESALNARQDFRTKEKILEDMELEGNRYDVQHEVHDLMNPEIKNRSFQTNLISHFDKIN